MRHIAFTGGGSGGHIMPIAALIEYGLQDTEICAQCKLFRLGEKDSMEQTVAHQFSDVTFVPITAGKLRRYFGRSALRKNIQDLAKGVRGIGQAVYFLHKHRIDVVFCKGGYVALPVSLAAFCLRIPIIVHESDTHAGMTNRLVARLSRQVFVGFPDILTPSTLIGQLLTPRLLHPESLNTLGKDATKTTVLVMGGSQGAKVLFDRLLAYLHHHPQSSFHFLVLVGTKNQAYKKQFDAFESVTSFLFVDRPEIMAGIYQLTDISITRGSATSLAEQHLFGIHKIIVPTPFTGGNHQRYNGVRYKDAFGDDLLEQNSDMNTQLTALLETYTGYKKQTQLPQQESLLKPLQEVWHTLLLSK